MVWRVVLVRIQTSVIGCNNIKKGFTLIEILVVLVVISIASSLIFLNFSSVVSISKNQSTFNKSFNYLSEESIITGDVIGWHANNENQFSYFLDNENQILSKIENPFSRNWQNLRNYKKTFRSSMIDVFASRRVASCLVIRTISLFFILDLNDDLVVVRDTLIGVS